MNPCLAAYGGSSGSGTGISISVHEDDLEKVDEIQSWKHNELIHKLESLLKL